MRLLSNYLATTSLVMLAALAATPLWAADLDASSAIDAVTVYPDGASVTRVISVDLTRGSLEQFPFQRKHFMALSWPGLSRPPRLVLIIASL